MMIFDVMMQLRIARNFGWATPACKRLCLFFGYTGFFDLLLLRTMIFFYQRSTSFPNLSNSSVRLPLHRSLCRRGRERGGAREEGLDNFESKDVNAMYIFY